MIDRTPAERSPSETAFAVLVRPFSIHDPDVAGVRSPALWPAGPSTHLQSAET